MQIQLTQGQVTLIDEVDADLAESSWYAGKERRGKTFYAARRVRNPDGTRSLERLHQVIARRMGIVGPPDHIDRNGLNNRRNNLRPDPNGRNNANKDRQRNNASGYRGVSWHRGAGKWQTSISVGGKTRGLGLYADKIEAAKAYDRAALEAFGEFAVLNFPEVP